MPRFIDAIPLRSACLALAILGSTTFFTPLAAAQDEPAEPGEPAENQPAESKEERKLGHQPYDPADPIEPPVGEDDVWGYAASDDANEAGAGEIEPERASSVEIVRARPKGELGHRWVQSISRWESGAARPAVSAQGDKVAFDAPSDTGFRGVYVRDLETDGRKCLTCENFQLRKKNVLAPEWHPSGDWIAVIVQDLPRRLLPNPPRAASFHRALHSDLWILTADGRDAWRLTRSSEQGGATHEAKISFEGDRIAWSERIDSGKGLEGEWVVRIAELELKKVPSIKKDRTLRPTSWPARVVVEGFTQDDGGLWLSATPRDRKGSLALRYGLESLRFDLVDTGGTWDMEPRSVPRGERIVLASDRNLPLARALPFTGDLWFTTPLGLRQERLTFFNDPSSDHHLGETLIADAAWMPDGRAVLLALVSVRGGVTEESLWRVDLSAGLQGADQGAGPGPSGMSRISLAFPRRLFSPAFVAPPRNSSAIPRRRALPGVKTRSWIRQDLLETYH